MADNTQNSNVLELDKYIRTQYAIELTSVPPEFPIYTKSASWPSEGGLFEPFIRVYQAPSLDPAPEKPEGATITSQVIKDGRTKDVYSKRFGTALTVTYERWKTGIKKRNSAHKATKLLSDSVRMTMENYNAVLINEAGAVSGDAPTPEMLGFDGLSPINAAHTYSNSAASTSRNLLATAQSVSYSALNDVVTLVGDEITTEDGYPYPLYRVNTLLIPPAEEMSALETLKSYGRPDTAQNAESVVKERINSGLSPSSVKVLHYMTSDRWFAFDSTRNECVRYMLEGPKIVGPIEDEWTHDMSWIVSFWISRAWWDWRGWVGVERP